jgi:sugar phosphate permease
MNRKFYGWTVVTLLFVCYAATTVSTNSLPFFFPELRKEFGWEHVKIVQPASYYFIYIAIFSPIVGYLLTKMPPKRVMFLGMLLSLVCTLGFASIQSYLHLHIVYFAFSAAITCCGLLPSMVIISNWFDKKRGLATGIFLVGSSAGNIIFPQLASYLIPTYGWRMAAVGVAVVAALISFIPLIFIKNSPSDKGQNRDGDTDDMVSKIVADDSTSIISFQNLLKTPVFYLLLFITAAFWFCGFGVLQNLRFYLEDYGFDIKQAANISSIFSLCSVLGKISFGYMSDKFNKYNVLLLATVGLICGILSLKMVSVSPHFAYIYAVFYGIGYSGAFAMIQLTVAELYKGASFRKVLGIVNSFDSIGGFIGVALMGYLRTRDGNYENAIWVLFSVCIFALVLAIMLRQSRKNRVGA